MLANYSWWKLFAPIGYNFHQYHLGETLTSILKRAFMGLFFTFSMVCSIENAGTSLCETRFRRFIDENKPK
jgi:hypothetical protein